MGRPRGGGGSYSAMSCIDMFLIVIIHKVNTEGKNDELCGKCFE